MRSMVFVLVLGDRSLSLFRINAHLLINVLKPLLARDLVLRDPLNDRITGLLVVLEHSHEVWKSLLGIEVVGC